VAKVFQLNISRVFDILGRVMKKIVRFTVDVLFAGDWLVADICMTLITPKPRPTIRSDMSSEGMTNRKLGLIIKSHSNMFSPDLDIFLAALDTAVVSKKNGVGVITFDDIYQVRARKRTQEK
jgi:hypothetical protein